METRPCCCIIAAVMGIISSISNSLDTKSNRDAMGARFRIVAGGISQIREIAGGGSYLSQSDLRANFGLGKATHVESVEVTWPSGQRQMFRNIEADKFYLVEEGKDQLQMQKFARKLGAG